LSSLRRYRETEKGNSLLEKYQYADNALRNKDHIGVTQQIIISWQDPFFVMKICVEKMWTPKTDKGKLLHTN
jgi:hypothetical protein